MGVPIKRKCYVKLLLNDGLIIYFIPKRRYTASKVNNIEKNPFGIRWKSSKKIIFRFVE